MTTVSRMIDRARLAIAAELAPLPMSKKVRESYVDGFTSGYRAALHELATMGVELEEAPSGRVVPSLRIGGGKGRAA